MLILRLKFEFLFWDTKNEHRGLLKILKEVGRRFKTSMNIMKWFQMWGFEVILRIEVLARDGFVGIKK